jgi:hypothetical protein
LLAQAMSRLVGVNFARLYVRTRAAGALQLGPGDL